MGLRPLQWCNSPGTPTPATPGWGCALQAIGTTADIARGRLARFPGLRTTSTRQATPKTHCCTPELASLLDGSIAGELIPVLARHGLQQLIELELDAFLGADCHERTEEPLGHRNVYRPSTLATPTSTAPRPRSRSIPRATQRASSAAASIHSSMNGVDALVPLGVRLLDMREDGLTLLPVQLRRVGAVQADVERFFDVHLELGTCVKP